MTCIQAELRSQQFSCSGLGTGWMCFKSTVNLHFAYRCTVRQSATCSVMVSRLQQTFTVQMMSFSCSICILYISPTKYWVGQSAEPRISFLWKYEMCFPSTSAILSWFPPGASVNLIPSLCMLAYTLLSYHITHLLMWAQHKLAYRDISEIWCHIQCCSLHIAYCYAYFVDVLL